MTRRTNGETCIMNPAESGAETFEAQQHPDYPEPQAHPDEPAADPAPWEPAEPEPQPAPAAESAAEPAPATKPAVVVSSVLVVLRQPHIHQGVKLGPGVCLSLSPELANALMRRGICKPAD